MAATSSLNASFRRRFFLFSSAVLFVIPVYACAEDYPIQLIDRVDAVHFGQAQVEVERMVERTAVELPPPLGGDGKHQEIDLGAVRLQFDSGRLVRIGFEREFDFGLGISAYPEAWRNFSPIIGGLHVQGGMDKLHFEEYLRSWEERAKALGGRRIERKRGYLLVKGEYSVDTTNDQFFDMIEISFGPERSTGHGGVWGDGCSINFVTQEEGRLYGEAPGTLSSISVFRDEFNTRARHGKIANPLPDPPPPSGTSPAGQEPRPR